MGADLSPEALFGPLLVVLQPIQSCHQSGQLRHGHMQRNHLCLQAHACMNPSSQHGSDHNKSFSLLALSAYWSGSVWAADAAQLKD